MSSYSEDKEVPLFSPQLGLDVGPWSTQTCIIRFLSGPSLDSPRLIKPPKVCNLREASPDSEASRGTVQLHTPVQTEICQPSRELKLKENFVTVPSINLYGDRHTMLLNCPVQRRNKP